MPKYINPYSDTNLLEFLSMFAKRGYAFLTNKLSFDALATDEIQIIVLSLIATSAALVGTFLVLKKMTMLANALSHTVLLGIVSAFLISTAIGPKSSPFQLLSIPTLMIAALITGLLTTFLTDVLTRVIRLQKDASIGLIFTLFFALGIILITLFSKNVHVGTELIMGNADALQKADIKIAFFVLILNLSLTLLLFNGFKITTFDPELAKTLGFFPLFFNYLIMIQTSVTAIGAFRAIGVLMILAFIVIPVLIARLFTQSLSHLIIVSVFIGIFSSILGVALSRHFLTYYGTGLSTGGIVVTLLGFSYFIALFFAPKRGIVVKIFWRKKLKINLSKNEC